MRTKVTNLKFPNGYVYSGQLLNNKFDGYGVLKYADNSRYEGAFLCGQKHGKGKYYYQTG